VSWSRISLNELIIVRRQWKVSIQALVMRAHDLGLLSSHQKARYYQQISARGWRKAEPGIVELEQPTTFSDALEIHRAHHRYTDAELATMIGLPQERLADLLPDYFTISGSSQARLRIIKPSAHDR
jgi:Zn-dependent peptidase ImmA (M78 family)